MCGVYVFIHVFMSIYMHVCAYRSQRLILMAFLHLSLSYIVREHHSLTFPLLWPELKNLASMVTHPFECGFWGGPNSCPYGSMASSLLAELSAQPTIFCICKIVSPSSYDSSLLIDLHLTKYLEHSWWVNFHITVTRTTERTIWKEEKTDLSHLTALLISHSWLHWFWAQGEAELMAMGEHEGDDLLQIRSGHPKNYFVDVGPTS